MARAAAPRHVPLSGREEAALQALINAALRLDAVAQPESHAATAALQAARHLWHDTICCAWAGYGAAEVAALRDLHAGLAPGHFRPPGGRSGLGATAGAFVNAVAACRDEACEGLALAHGRPGVPVIAALWALAAHRPLRWGELLQATVFGYQVGGAMGEYLRILPGMHVDGVWPSLGAAAAVAQALQLPPPRIVDAVETCASQLGASLYLPIAQGSPARNTYLGHSAWLGLTSALSAAAGIAGPRGAARESAQRVLQRPACEGPRVHATALIEQAYWKPYACVRHVQYGARAAQRLRSALRAAGDRSAGDGGERDEAADATAAIDGLRLRVYPEAITYCGNRAPASAIAAQFSLSHGVAAMLVRGDLGPAEFGPECLGDPRVRRLETMVELVPEPDHFGPGGRGAVLELSIGGRTHREEVRAIEGDAGCPPTLAQRRAKFAQYCGGSPAALALGERLLGAPLAAGATQVLEILE